MISSDHLGSKSRGGSARRSRVSHKEKLARTHASITTSGVPPIIPDRGPALARRGPPDQPPDRFFGAHRAAADHAAGHRGSTAPPARSVHRNCCIGHRRALARPAFSNLPATLRPWLFLLSILHFHDRYGTKGAVQRLPYLFQFGF